MATRRELIEIELVRLEGEANVLERDWRRIPYLAVLVVLAVPVYYVWGAIAALGAVLAVPCLVVTALYLIGVRRYENKQNIEELRAQLARLAK